MMVADKKSYSVNYHVMMGCTDINKTEYYDAYSNLINQW